MNIARFDSVEAMEHQARQLLEEHFQYEASGPHAVMLTGGRTPVGLYRDLAAAPPVANDQLHILVSDERHVPLDSPDCNYSHMSEMVQGIGVDDSRVIRVHTELELDEAADRYDRELTAFLDSGGRITLGILGLGADGHVASLFSFDDIDRGVGRNAISVPRTLGPDRISVTSDLLTGCACPPPAVLATKRPAVTAVRQPSNVNRLSNVCPCGAGQVVLCPVG